ncbi:MAG TPA: hypothetical protein VFX15_02765 [Actinomycetes bacterium]|nr:hypothetical protein [Actinomycetes bacterium]
MSETATAQRSIDRFNEADEYMRDADVLYADVDRIAEALRRADYMNWTAAEVAEKIAGTVEHLIWKAYDRGVTHGIEFARLRGDTDES